MNQIVKEELMRSIAVFFFALIFTSFLLAKFNLPASFFTVVGFPLLITVVVSAVQVKRRSAKVYEKPNMKDVALHALPNIHPKEQSSSSFSDWLEQV